MRDGVSHWSCDRSGVGVPEESWYLESLMTEPTNAGTGADTPTLLARRLTEQAVRQPPSDLAAVWFDATPFQGSNDAPSRRHEIEGSAEATLQLPGTWLYRYPRRLLAAGALLARAAEKHRKQQVWFMHAMAVDASESEHRRRTNAKRCHASATTACEVGGGTKKFGSIKRSPLSELDQQALQGRVRQSCFLVTFVLP
eukprot:SAG31_NODE_6335_length_2060_cov_1.387557_2_plen_198_part_00